MGLSVLDEAVKKSGFIHEAYSRFHNYSLGNQLLALFQCFERGIQPGPLATFHKWKELARPTRQEGNEGINALMLVALFGAVSPITLTFDLEDDRSFHQAVEQSHGQGGRQAGSLPIYRSQR